MPADKISPEETCVPSGVLLACAHCGHAAMLRIEIRDDEIYPPRPHWHAKVECVGCGSNQHWHKVSDQLADDGGGAHPMDDKIQAVKDRWNYRQANKVI